MNYLQSSMVGHFANLRGGLFLFITSYKYPPISRVSPQNELFCRVWSSFIVVWALSLHFPASPMHMAASYWSLTVLNQSLIWNETLRGAFGRMAFYLFYKAFPSRDSPHADLPDSQTQVLCQQSFQLIKTIFHISWLSLPSLNRFSSAPRLGF